MSADTNLMPNDLDRDPALAQVDCRAQALTERQPQELFGQGDRLPWRIVTPGADTACAGSEPLDWTPPVDHSRASMAARRV